MYAIRSLTTFTLAAIFAGGCASLFDKRSDDEAKLSLAAMEAAEKEGDSKTLDDACQRRRKVERDMYESACHAMSRVAEARGDFDWLSGVCEGTIPFGTATRKPSCQAAARLSLTALDAFAGDCANIIEGYRSAYPKVPWKHQDDFVVRAAAAIAKCQHWRFFFEELVSRDTYGQDSVGYKALVAAEEAGAPVEAGVLAYINAHAEAPFAFERGEFSISHIVSWLNATKKFGHCDALSGYVGAAEDRIQANFLDYFAAAGCKVGAQMATERLRHDDPLMRVQACRVLGKLGSRKHVKVLEAVGANDPAWRKGRRGERIFYVRDACKGAVAALATR